MDLHPFLVSLAETYRRTGRPLFSSGSPADARALVASSREALGPGPADVTARAVRVPTRAGSVGARLFHTDDPVQGVLVYLHGGGWMTGTLDDFDALCRHLARRSGCAVLLLEYRLAPEHPFPAGLEDVEDTLCWVADGGLAHSGHLSPCKRPLLVGGDSAGGNLAAVAANTLAPAIRIALQLLIYPVTDAAMANPSYIRHGDSPFLTSEDMRWFYGHYAPASRWLDPRISPLRAADLSESPPAWIAVSEHDVLHDEGVAYAQRLRAAGVPVTLHRYEGVTHSIARMMNVLDVANQMIDDASAAARAACQGPAADAG